MTVHDLIVRLLQIPDQLTEVTPELLEGLTGKPYKSVDEEAKR